MPRSRRVAGTIAIGVVLAGVSTVSSQSTVSGLSLKRLERVTAVLDDYIAAGEIAGAVSLIYRHGEVVHVSARGVQDLDTRAPMVRDTIFGLASMTKPVTAVAVMMLVEAGAIGLDEPVDRWLPELASPKVLDDPHGPLDEVHDAPRAITVRDLLRYTMGTGSMGYAGISDEAPIAQAHAQLRSRRDELTPDQYLERLGAVPLVYAPGERFMYNTPSTVAGVLIPRVSGMGLDQFMETKIFDPLGMRDTGFVVPADKRARLASYYRAGEQPGTLVKVEDNETRYREPPVFPSASGGLVSTVDDYLRFARMLLQKGEVDGVRLLSRESVELMTTDQMPKEPHRRFFISDGFWRGAGFGLGLQVTTEWLDPGPSAGSFWWHGATGVQWTADPHEDLIFLRFIQRRGGPRGLGADYMEALYAAIVD